MSVEPSARHAAAREAGLPGPRAEPEQPRLLGRSRAYTTANLPERLRQWHAPRINRWERLWVTEGPLVIEYLGASGVTRVELGVEENRWFAPGTRWRVMHMVRDTSFELEVHADIKGQAEAPRSLRADLLEEATVVSVAGVDVLAALLDALPVGARRVVHAGFDLGTWSGLPTGVHTLSWHPLTAAPGCFTVLVARSDQPFDLAAYLGRDHAVIEAALGGALAGDSTYAGWLRATLERHLRTDLPTSSCSARCHPPSRPGSRLPKRPGHLSGARHAAHEAAADHVSPARAGCVFCGTQTDATGERRRGHAQSAD